MREETRRRYVDLYIHTHTHYKKAHTPLTHTRVPPTATSNILTLSYKLQTPTHPHTQVREVLYLMNPNKIRVCEYLMRYHEERGDKIIIFSDSVYALSKYAQLFGRDAIYGMYIHTHT